MHVLAITHRIPFPPTDGGRIAVLGMLRGLSRVLGPDISTIVLVDKREPTEYLASLKNELSDLHCVRHNQKNSAVGFLWAWLTGRLPYSLAKYASREALVVARRLVLDKDISVVYLEHLQSFWIGRKLKEEFPHLKIVLREHNVETLILERLAAESRSVWRRLLYRNQAIRMESAERSALGFADLIFSISDVDRRILMERFLADGKTVKNVPVGVERRNVVKKPRTAEFTVIVVGSMDWEPNRLGAKWLIEEVIPLVAPGENGIRFCFVGKGTERLLRERSAAIKTVGFVEDIEPYFEEASMAAVPLRSGSGIRVKILEFMSRCVPVVTTAVGIEGIASAHDASQLAIIADSADEFAKSIRRLKSDGALRERIAARAHAHVQIEYNWERIVQEVVAEFQRLAGS